MNTLQELMGISTKSTSRHQLYTLLIKPIFDSLSNSEYERYVIVMLRVINLRTVTMFSHTIGNSSEKYIPNQMQKQELIKELSK